MQALRELPHKTGLIVLILTIWWLYASMTLCFAYGSSSQSSQNSVNSSASSHLHSSLERADINDHAESSMIDISIMAENHGGDMDHHSHAGHHSMSGGQAEYCCDELQEGSATGFSPVTSFFALAYAWITILVEDTKTAFSLLTFGDSRISSTPIYLLVCSFLK